MSKLTKFLTRPYRGLWKRFRKQAGPSSTKGKSAPPAKPPVKPNNAFADGQFSLLTSLLQEGEYDALKKAWGHAFAGANSTLDIVNLLSIKAECELAGGEHDELMATAHRITDVHNGPVGNFYKAQSYFVRGMNQDAKRALHHLLLSKPGHADGVYLLCEIADRTGEKEMAWQMLERLSKLSRRGKTWHLMANLVQTDADLFRLLGNWSEWKSNKFGPAYNRDVSEFISLGALRAGNDDLAKAIWRDSLFSALHSKHNFKSLNVRKPSYSSLRAEKALSDINRVLLSANIDMFLVSGTLLGCVREQRLLGHDKDIDIGIWDNVSEQTLFDVLTKSGLFFALRSRSKEIIRLRHVNGIAIDVFYHYREPTDYWHGGVKMVWHNTPFELVQHPFLGESYLIPENYDLYLTENYGDWRTPKIAFDSAFDTPNGEAISDAEMTIHSFKGLMDSCIANNSEKIVFYLNRLVDYGETRFVEAFKFELANTHIDLSKFEEVEEREEYDNDTE